MLAFSCSAAIWQTVLCRPETIPMSQEHGSRTDITLLARLRQHPRDQAAWSEFVARYGPKVLSWCRRWRLQEADAEDVTQEVLAKLSARMICFTYDAGGSFRAWLKTLVHHAWRDLLDGRKRAGIAVGGSQIGALLESLDAGDGLVQELEEEFHRELMDCAIERVRLKLSSRAWEVFRLTALEGWAAAAAAAHLHMKIAQVYLVKSRVTKRIREEAQRLERHPPIDSPVPD
jgi:RNA polymerase sigma-70 factor (ECF subfamily)